MKKQNYRIAHIRTIRDELQQQAHELTIQLDKSINRPVSCDIEAYPEYNLEVTKQYQITDQILFIQKQRSALEHALEKGKAVLTYRHIDGKTSKIRFIRLPRNRVKVI